MGLPNFFIIGVAKAGTTSLYNYLNQHPEIYLSEVKEPCFFLFGKPLPAINGPGYDDVLSKRVTNYGEYTKLFDNVSGEKAIGEASAFYLYSSGAARRIKKAVPDARMIVILRDPADRAFSAFMHTTIRSREPIASFAKALEEEPSRIKDNWAPIWHYKKMGFYFDQLQQYIKIFDRSRIKIFLHDDLNDDAGSLCKEAFGFLGVDDSFSPDFSIKHNISGIPKKGIIGNISSRAREMEWPLKDAIKWALPDVLQKKLSDMLKSLSVEKQKMVPAMRRLLVMEYRDDIIKLQALVGRDLSRWLE